MTLVRLAAAIAVAVLQACAPAYAQPGAAAASAPETIHADND